MKRPVKNAFSPVPAAVHQKVLTALREVKTTKPVRRKMSIILLAALLTLLLLTGAAVAANHWGVLQYLFGGAQHADDKVREKVWEVGQTKTAQGVAVTIDSVLYDGERLAVGWTFENTVPADPAYIVLGSFTADGRRINIDSNDLMDHAWLPGFMDGSAHREPLAREGFTGTIEGGAPEGVFDVILRISVFKPAQPVFSLKDSDYRDTAGQTDFARRASAIWEKSQLGYLVVDGDGEVQLTFADDPGKVYVGGTPEEIASTGKFVREDMVFSFSLDAGRASEGRIDLPVDTVYRFDGFTARYVKAALTAASTSLVAELMPEDGTYASAVSLMEEISPCLTDLEGNPLAFQTAYYPYGIGPVEKEDGTWVLQLDYSLLPALAAIPSAISITWTDKDGKRALMPLAVP